MQPGDVPATWASTALLEQLTGFKPATSLSEGVRRLRGVVPRVLWRLTDGIDSRDREPAAAMAMIDSGALLVLVAVAGLALLISGGLIVLLSPWLKAYALARPNARSSHREPTPQGGGAAVVAATLAAAWLGAVACGRPAPLAAASQFLALTAATVLLAVVGAVDDIRTLPALPRLAPARRRGRHRDRDAAGRLAHRFRRCPGGSSAPACSSAASGSSI